MSPEVGLVDGRVSVVVATYGRPTLLPRALDSALRQTYEDVELIIVDDNDPGSEDRIETEQLVNQYTAGDHRIRYVQHQRNVGVSAARNSGVESASGEFVAFLDDDDEWLPPKLERQLGLFSQDPCNPALVYCGWHVRDEFGQSLRCERPSLRGHVLQHLGLNRIGPPSAVVVRTQVFRNVGGFDERLPPREDIDLYVRIAAICTFDYVDDCLLEYLQHGASMSGRLAQKIRAYEIFFEKHRRFVTASKKRYSEYREREGELRIEAGQSVEARSHFLSAIRIDPSRTMPYLKLAASLAGSRAYRSLQAVLHGLRAGWRRAWTSTSGA